MFLYSVQIFPIFSNHHQSKELSGKVVAGLHLTCFRFQLRLFFPFWWGRSVAPSVWGLGWGLQTLHSPRILGGASQNQSLNDWEGTRVLGLLCEDGLTFSEKIKKMLQEILQNGSWESGWKSWRWPWSALSRTFLMVEGIIPRGKPWTLTALSWWVASELCVKKLLKCLPSLFCLCFPFY